MAAPSWSTRPSCATRTPKTWAKRTYSSRRESLSAPSHPDLHLTSPPREPLVPSLVRRVPCDYPPGAPREGGPTWTAPCCSEPAAPADAPLSRFRRSSSAGVALQKDQADRALVAPIRGPARILLDYRALRRQTGVHVQGLPGPDAHSSLAHMRMPLRARAPGRPYTMHECIYTHKYVYVCICIHVYAYVCICMYVTHTHTHTHTHTRIDTHTLSLSHTHTDVEHLLAAARADARRWQAYVCMYTYVCKHVCMYVCMHV